MLSPSSIVLFINDVCCQVNSSSFEPEKEEKNEKVQKINIISSSSFKVTGRMISLLKSHFFIIININKSIYKMNHNKPFFYQPKEIDGSYRTSDLSCPTNESKTKECDRENNIEENTLQKI